MLREMRNFLLRGNVVDLAVAVILGLAFNEIVNAFANDFLLGLIGAVFGQPNFSDLTFTVRGSEVNYGSTIAAIVNFLLVGTALFFIIRALSRLPVPRPEEEPSAPPSEEVVLLRQIRDALTPGSRR